MQNSWLEAEIQGFSVLGLFSFFFFLSSKKCVSHLKTQTYISIFIFYPAQIRASSTSMFCHFTDKQSQRIIVIMLQLTMGQKPCDW